jgi:hypothetical protein
MKLNEDKIKAILASAGETLSELSWSESGANSRSARVLTASGREVFVKGYLIPEGDNRPRVDTEFVSLRFLWENGIRDICQPLATDPENEISLFSSIKGRRFRPEFIKAEDVTTAADFYASLQNLQSAAVAAGKGIGVASEACFSFKDHLERIEARVKSLEEVADSTLQDWMSQALRPAWDALKGDFEESARQIGLDPEAVLPQERRILSSSDVGFHNIMREEGADRLVFIDFEYFGWDDPVKLASDFILQPSVPLPQNFKGPFIKRIMKNFDWTNADRERFLLYYPLLSFKWCLIVLNVFFPNRRPFLTGDISALLARRLKISGKLFDRMLDELKSREYEKWVA